MSEDPARDAINELAEAFEADLYASRPKEDTMLDVEALLDGIRDEVLEAVIEGDRQGCSSPDCIADAVHNIVRVRLRGYSLIPTEELTGLRAALDEAYADRNLVVQAFAQAMADADWPVAWGVDRDEPDWPVIYIDTPEGQVSWHIPKAERLYEPLDRTDSHGPAVWDGHSTETKFARLRAALEAKGPR